LKARKTLTKEPRKKIKNQDNKDRNEKKIWEILIEWLNWKKKTLIKGK
jgi:hypothetical protein